MLIKLPITTPTVILNANPQRRRFTIQMQAELVDANNIGKVYIGVGFQPRATVGAHLQGEVLIQSAVIEKPEAGHVLEENEKAVVWAVADTADQTLIVEEYNEP